MEEWALLNMTIARADIVILTNGQVVKARSDMQIALMSPHLYARYRASV